MPGNWVRSRACLASVTMPSGSHTAGVPQEIYMTELVDGSALRRFRLNPNSSAVVEVIEWSWECRHPLEVNASSGAWLLLVMLPSRDRDSFTF